VVPLLIIRSCTVLGAAAGKMAERSTDGPARGPTSSMSRPSAARMNAIFSTPRRAP
jgi:hypothetical protein